MEAKITKTKTPNELNKKIQELKAELFTLRFQNAVEKSQHPHKIKKIKKEIARIFTILAKQNAEQSLSKKIKNTVKKAKPITHQTKMTKVTSEKPAEKTTSKLEHELTKEDKT